jgi:ubiquinone/menaquinone biosynthesis C-methylase UbiE
MDKEKYLTEFKQTKVNEIWQDVWLKSGFAAENIFSGSFFLEAWKVIEKYIPQKTEAILEVGGGSGRFGIKIAQTLPASKVVIIDIVDSSISLINEVAKKIGLENVFALKGDVTRLSFPNNSFDLVFSDAVIQHVLDDEKAVWEMARVLKPGGILIVSVVNRWNFHSLYKLWLRIIGKEYEYKSERAYGKKELRKLFKGQGLEIAVQDGFYPGYGILRLKSRHEIFKLLGRICNRMFKILDRHTGRFFSKSFGFEIVIIGRKPPLL